MNGEEQNGYDQEEEEGGLAYRLGSALGSGVRSVASGVGKVASGLITLTPKGVAAARTITAPTVPGLVTAVPAPVEEERADDLSDLFIGPQPEDNDIYIDDLVTVDDEDEEEMLEPPEQEGIEDLVRVTTTDIMGPKPKPKTAKGRFVQVPPTIRGL